MRLGVVFPQVEIEPDPAAIRRYAAAVEELGFDHVLVYDHVTGVDPEAHPDFVSVARTGGATSPKPYDVHDTFHEVMVLMGFLAAVSELELVTGVLVLPQRQTVLVAKQAAEVDLLTGGRFRLGVGIGWNAVEYEALGTDFTTRGARLGEQIELMRKLWSEDSVTFQGKYHTVTGAGIAPPPVQRPIPVWIGASSPPALRRTGRLADGWFPQAQPGPKLDDAVRLVHQAAKEAGRDPTTLGMEGRTDVTAGNIDDLAGRAAAWREAGATHLSLNTMGAGFASVDQHIAALAGAAGVLLEPTG
jgi:probable F420-dependent oxidoreductase